MMKRSDAEEGNASVETDSPSSVRQGQYEPEWVPGSRYFQKLRAQDSQEVTYQLRTRQRCRSGPEESRREEPSRDTNSPSNPDIARETNRDGF